MPLQTPPRTHYDFGQSGLWLRVQDSAESWLYIASAPSHKLLSPRQPRCDLPGLAWEFTWRPAAVTVPLGGPATLLPGWIFCVFCRTLLSSLAAPSTGSTLEVTEVGRAFSDGHQMTHGGDWDQTLPLPPSQLCSEDANNSFILGEGWD